LGLYCKKRGLFRERGREGERERGREGERERGREGERGFVSDFLLEIVPDKLPY
jgi:hypothetical protein